jgi:hypothetical protein
MCGAMRLTRLTMRSLAQAKTIAYVAAIDTRACRWGSLTHASISASSELTLTCSSCGIPGTTVTVHFTIDLRTHLLSCLEDLPQPRFLHWYCYTPSTRQSLFSPQAGYLGEAYIEEELSHWSIRIPGTRKSPIQPCVRRQPREEAMAAIWESHKDTLHALYVNQNETLKNIMVRMKELHGFEMKCENLSQLQCSIKSLILLQKRPIRAAVYKMGVSQKSTAKSWKIVSRKVTLRQRQGKTSVVRRDGEEISQEKLSKRKCYVPLLELAHDGK